MKIHYRIVKVDPAAHGVVVRYFTDKVTEMDLANSIDKDGTVILNADGYPLSTRTDVMMSIFDTPTPSNEEIERRIMLSAPIDWLRLQENIKDPDVDTKMKSVRDLTGESSDFTLDDIEDLKKTIAAAHKEEAEKEGKHIEKAYESIVALLDALKVIAAEDPHALKGFYDTFSEIRKIAEES